MPKATQQLDKVTKETELATTEMPDKIERILNKINDTNTGLNERKSVLKKWKNIKVLIKGKFAGIPDFENKEKVLSGIQEIIEQNIDIRKETKSLKDVENTFNKIQNDVFGIMNSLQFQDITSQQIRAANFPLIKTFIFFHFF
ncbi:hypothetical protein ACFL4T_14770, partial [candidate division KSB1 bacterium]